MLFSFVPSVTDSVPKNKPIMPKPLKLQGVKEIKKELSVNEAGEAVKMLVNPVQHSG